MPKIIWWPQMAGGFFSRIPKTETLHFFTDYIHQPLPTHQQTSSHRYPLLFAIFSEPWNNWVLGRPWKPSCCIHLSSGIHHFPLRRHGEKNTTTDRSKEPKMLRRQCKDTRLLGSGYLVLVVCQKTCGLSKWNKKCENSNQILTLTE